MTEQAVTADLFGRMEEHLREHLPRTRRQESFDMDDEPDAAVLAPFPQLAAALQWLADNVTTPWWDVDYEARAYQQKHRWVARSAIIAGTAAIILAIVQLALAQTAHALTPVATWIEVAAVSVALIAVVYGRGWKIERRWLVKRHLAERLRMLRFRAIEQLFRLDLPEWQQWVEERKAELARVDDFRQIEEWSQREQVEQPPLPPTSHTVDPRFVQALAVYYRIKRIEFQAHYFETRKTEYRDNLGRWPHVTLWLFSASVLCVGLHVLFETWHWTAAAVWLVAFAAMIPVFGYGVRAWFAAFEVPRSASLFEAKQTALQHAAAQMANDSSVTDIQWHIAHTEHFLENEHREWLRLLRETEWFL